MDEAREKDQVILYAYVLMPNHFHLFVETPLGNIQRFMQRLSTAYGMYHRFKHRRPGHCFQGRYGAKVVRGDESILRLTRYIHLNPVKIEAAKQWTAAEKMRRLNAYGWSSYPGYAGLAKPEERIDYRWLELMDRGTDRGRRQAYRRYVEGMAVEEDEAFLRTLGRSGYAIGDERFVKETAEELKARQIERAVTGDIAWPEDRMLEPEEVEASVVEALGIRSEDLRFHGRRLGALKGVAVDLCCVYTGRSQREVARYFGYGSESAVGKMRRLVAARLAADRGLSRQVARLRKRLDRRLNSIF